MLKFAALVCLVVVVAAHKGKGKYKDGGPGGPPPEVIKAMEEEFKKEPRACNPAYLIKAEECANTPVVFSMQTMQPCQRKMMQENMLAKVKATRNGGRGKRDASSHEDGVSSEEQASGTNKNRRAKLSRNNKKERLEMPEGAGFGGRPDRKNMAFARAGGCGSPLCLMQCVLNSTNHLNTDGTLNLAALKQSYVDKAGDSAFWKDLAAKVVDYCYTNVTTTSGYSAPAVEGQPEPEKKCNDTSLRFVTCAQKLLLLNGTTTETLKVTTPQPLATSCQDRNSALAVCDHNFIYQMPKNMREKGSKDLKKGRASSRLSQGRNGGLRRNRMRKTSSTSTQQPQ